jgi:tetratricopeptide (TPR) repeat protein
MNKQELEQSLQIALDKKDKEELEALARQTISRHPEDPMGYAYLAEAILLQNPIPFEKAEYCLAKASQLDPTDNSYIAKFATIKTQKGEMGIAQILWGKILRSEPNHLEALTARAHYCMYTTNDYRQAIKFFDQIIQYHSEHTKSYFHRASAHFEMASYGQALQDYNRAVELSNGVEDMDALLLKLAIVRALEQSQAIIDTYEAILEIEPDSIFYRRELARVFVAEENHEKASEHYSRILELMEEPDANISYSLGQVLLNSKKYEEALEAFAVFVKHSKNPELAFLMQIETLIKLHRFEEALEIIQQAQEVTEDDYKKNQLILFHAETLLQLKRFTEAHDILAPAINNTGMNKSKGYALLGVIYFCVGMEKNAYEFLRAASVQKNDKATNFIRKNLHQYSYALQQKTLEENQTTIDKNSRSIFINNIKGKVWRFKDLQSEDLKQYEAAAVDAVKQSMFTTTFFFTEKGALNLNNEGAFLFLYKIIQETSESSILELTPLDQWGENVNATVTLSGNGLLNFSKQEDQVCVLEHQKTEDLDEVVKTQLTKFIQPDTLALLGVNASKLVHQVWPSA